MKFNFWKPEPKGTKNKETYNIHKSRAKISNQVSDFSYFS